MDNLHIIDIIFIILAVLMIIHGYLRGFITELFSWAAIVVAVLAAFFLHGPVAEMIRENFMPTVRYVPELLGFTAVFIAAITLCKLVERILKNVVSGANLGVLDKILGAAFGFVEGIAIIALILFVLGVQPFYDVSAILRDSVFAQILLPHIRALPIDMGGNAVIALFQGVRSSV